MIFFYTIKKNCPKAYNINMGAKFERQFLCLELKREAGGAIDGLEIIRGSYIVVIHVMT